MATIQTVDKATVVNWALPKLGLAPVYTIDSETELGGTVDLIWPHVIAECFSVHDWSFCRRTVKLDRHARAPENGWRYGFDLPGDRIGEPLKVLRCAGAREEILRNYTLEGGSLYADEPYAWARCRLAVEPETWDIGFRSVFVIALASALAVPLIQDKDLADTLYAEAFGTPSQGGTGGKFGRLIAQNRASEPLGSPMLRDDPLTSARW
ncbi:hypothetical protein M1D80_11815 [Phyllobacteriaceae bacterium JZ32]